MVVFLSHKMSDVPVEEVNKIREKAMKEIRERFPNEEITFIDNYNHPDAPDNVGRLWHLGRSIQQMDEADAVYFCDGNWEESKGCIIEKKIVELYGIRVLNPCM